MVLEDRFRAYFLSLNSFYEWNLITRSPHDYTLTNVIVKYLVDHLQNVYWENHFHSVWQSALIFTHSPCSVVVHDLAFVMVGWDVKEWYARGLGDRFTIVCVCVSACLALHTSVHHTFFRSSGRLPNFVLNSWVCFSRWRMCSMEKFSWIAFVPGTCFGHMIRARCRCSWHIFHMIYVSLCSDMFPWTCVCVHVCVHVCMSFGMHVCCRKC